MIGAITAVVFLTVGGSMIVEERLVLGGILVGLGALRAVVLVAQMRKVFGSDEDEA